MNRKQRMKNRRTEATLGADVRFRQKLRENVDRIREDVAALAGALREAEGGPVTLTAAEVFMGGWNSAPAAAKK